MPGSAPDKSSQRPTFTLKATLRGHESGIASLKFSIGRIAGKYLGSGSADKSVKLWDAKSGELLHTLVGHTKGINDIAWEDTGRFLASASDDTTLRLWSVETGKCLRVLEGHTNFVFSCAFNLHSNMLVSGSHDETLKVWAVRTGSCIRSIPAHSDPVTSVQFSCDGTVILSASFDGLARLWDAENGKCLCTIIDDDSIPPLALARFSPNGQYILTGSLDSQLKLWRLADQRNIRTYNKGHQNVSLPMFATFVTSHPYGSMVVTGSEDNSIWFYDLNTGEEVARISGQSGSETEGDGHSDSVLAVDAHPVEPLVASGGLSKDCTIKIWEDRGIATN